MFLEADPHKDKHPNIEPLLTLIDDHAVALQTNAGLITKDRLAILTLGTNVRYSKHATSGWGTLLTSSFLDTGRSDMQNG